MSARSAFSVPPGCSTPLIAETDSKFLAAFSKAGEGTTSPVRAQSILQSIGKIVAPEMPAKVRYDRIYPLLAKHLPNELRDRLTLRRVRAIWNLEARRVDEDEIIALRRVEAIERAKREHREFVAYTTKLARLHHSGSTYLSREELEVLARIASRSPDVEVDSDAGSSNEIC